ncbi:hypothetical protein AVEN_191552-1 [Araneus ventricosus]|uniref:Uncharacterized protein n=1 Tax=Araneus ventricosus TaxID=182803 RepID=A0A4Y2KZM6_ARAVE|nr:hypothetical protein AVEN_191552-1 [Araneus ventricosus]
MPWTRAMDEKFEMLLAMMIEMKAGQEEMKAGQEEIKAGLEKKMETGQERMEQVQEEMKDLIRAGKEEMRTHVESQVKGIKDHVDGCIGRMEEEVQDVKGKIEEVQGEVRMKIEEVKSEVQEKMSDLERRLSDLETRPNNVPANPELIQLVASLRGSAAEVLQGIPADKLTDLSTIEKALESRFGDSHLKQFYRTELKTRRQKPEESLQVLAADVERLMSLAYAECPPDVRGKPSSSVLHRRHQGRRHAAFNEVDGCHGLEIRSSL